MKRYVLNLLQFSFLFIANQAFSQIDTINIYDLDLNQLSKLKITSASKITQNLNEIPSSIYVITAAMIKERGYTTIEEALSELPGFQQRNTLGVNNYVFQRGIPNQNNLTLVLIDGVQVNEINTGDFYGGGQYNLSNVDRIEVIYGPSSVAYGTNAVTGIVNIITKSAFDKRVELNSTVGNFNTSVNDFSFCTSNKEKTFGILASGMIKKSDKAVLTGRAGDYNWTDLMDNFEDDYAFDVKAQLKDFSVGTNYQYKKVSTATNTPSVGSIFRDYGTSWNIRFINNYLKYNKKFSKNFNLSSILYNRNATVMDNTIYSIVDTAQIGYYRPSNLSGFENVFSYTGLPFFSITAGLTLELQKLSPKNSFSFSDSPELAPPDPAKPAMLNNSRASAFVETQIPIIDKLFLSWGVRYDKSSLYEQPLTTRAGLNYHFGKHIMRYSYAEAFRAPYPWDYSDGVGNPSLLPEKMKSLEASFTFSIAENYKLDFVTYKNNLTNVITKKIVYEGYQWTNRGQVNTNGVEVYLRHSSSFLKTSLNYTFNQSFDESGAFVPEISKHSGNASVTFLFYNYFMFNVRANYIGKRENPVLISFTDSKIIDPCLLFHSQLSFVNYKGFSLRFTIKNILNKEYYHTSNRTPERYRQPQRTFLFTVSYALDN